MAILITALSHLAAANTPRLSPLTVQRGETVTFTYDVAGCPPSDYSLDENSIEISGSGIELKRETAHATDCSFAITAQISATAPFGTRDVLVYNQGRTKRVASFKLEVVDLQGGPIPPGLTPQVDVMWSVMSEGVCSDQFGTRLARGFYCVEVQLGNNTGYALLLAGVGFLRNLPAYAYRESNASYLQVRSVLQREQVVSGRNISLRALQAAGVVIGGFTPFSGNAGRRGRIGIWSSLVGDVLAGAFEGLIPDRTIRQLSNLDDAALHDGRLIPNNSPVKFTVFVDRESIVPLLTGTRCFLAYWLGETRRELERTTQDYEMAGRMHAAEDRLSVLRETIRELQDRVKELEQQRSGRAAGRTSGCEPGKIPRTGRGLNPLGRGRADAERDLLAVRRALGTLILVGDQIEYKQRIRVDSTAVVPEVRPNPIVGGILNGDVAQQGGKVTLILVGRWLTNAVVTARNCIVGPVKASSDATGTEITLPDFTVPETCTDPAIHLIVSTGATSPAHFDVPIENPKIDDAQPNPIQIDDGKDQSVDLTITGSGLAGAKAKVAVNASGTLTDAKTVDVTSTAPAKVVLKVSLTAAQAKDGGTLEVTLTARGVDAKPKRAVALKKSH